MINRFSNRMTMLNNNTIYEDYFFQRGLKHINQYETPAFSALTKENVRNLQLKEHVWKTGDKFYKLANTYYGDSRDWWIIAKFNNKPTESHVKIGDVLLIPTPLQIAAALLR